MGRKIALNGKTAKRESVIDVARGLALVFMVVGHLGIKSRLTQWIYSFHMPLFFFISGMTVQPTADFRTYIRKRIKRLYVPYLLFALIYANSGVKNYLYVLYGSRNALEHARSLTPLWFLPCLFVAGILLQGILICSGSLFPRGPESVRGGVRLVIDIPLVLLCVGTGILLSRRFDDGLRLPFGVDSALISMPFLYAGYVCSASGCYRPSRGAVSRVVFLMLLCTGVTLALYGCNLPVSVTEGFNHVELSIASIGKSRIFYAVAMCGCIGILCAAILLKECRWIEILGQSSLTCLATHGMVISLVSQLLRRFRAPDAVITVVAFVTVMICILPIQKIIDEFIPNMNGY